MFNKVHIEISNVCNLQCSFCPEVIRDKKLIDIELFENIVKQVAPITEQVAFHLMGDPLVHPKLAQLVEICGRYKAPIFLVTNGVLMNAKNRAILLSPAFRQINFSLHSFNDNFPGRDPSAYLESIFSFTEEALTLRPELYLNYRLWNLADVQGSTEANRSLLQRIAQRFGGDVITSSDVRFKKSFKVKGRLYLHFDTEFKWPDLTLPVLGLTGKCYGLKSHFGILADGTVVPCCLDKEGTIALGNVKDAPISEILNGPRAKALITGFQQKKLVEDLCQRCQFIERFDVRARRSSEIHPESQ
jgi:radical SAM protein with 4Fe4S-binding SPASM domain